MKINIELSNIQEATNKFNGEELSEDLNEYIINKCKFKIIKNTKIILNITNLKSKNDKQKLYSLIHNYYEQKASIFKKFDLIDNYIRIFLLVLGIIAIFISEQLPILLSELFLIAGWVLVWEIFYDLLFNEIKRKRSFKIYEALTKCEINFID